MCCGVGTEATLWEQLLSYLPADSGLMAIRPGWQILAEFKGEGTSQAPKIDGVPQLCSANPTSLVLIRLRIMSLAKPT